MGLKEACTLHLYCDQPGCDPYNEASRPTSFTADNYGKAYDLARRMGWNIQPIYKGPETTEGDGYCLCPKHNDMKDVRIGSTHQVCDLCSAVVVERWNCERCGNHVCSDCWYPSMGFCRNCVDDWDAAVAKDD